jgi:signal transduction histidine kinase
LAAPELGGVVVSTSPEFAQHLQWLMVYLPVVSSITALSAWQEVERAAARKAAHHAKNAVSNVRGLIARFGLAQEGGFTSHDLNYFRERLESIAQRLEAMHDDFTRGVTARPEATRMSLQNFLEGIQAEAREAFPDLTVTLRLPEKEVHVVASPIDMHHTFWELLTNAAHWTQGHGTVDISACLATEENSAASPWSVSPPVVRVDVQDDGPGIPLDRRGLIWVEGYTTRPEGKGRGLSFARDSVVRSGGSMWVDDPVDGKGTHFVLLLPQATLENSASQNQD